MNALPYVYMGTHKETGKFYIGSRVRNKEPWSIDLPKYRTSSKIVKPIFDEFEWKILMEFSDGKCAIEYEQYMIHESWGNPLLLNRSCHYENSKLFSTIGRDSKGNLNGFFGKTHSDETKMKWNGRRNVFRDGRKHSEESKNKNRLSHLGKKLSEEHIRKSTAHLIGNKHRLGKPFTEEQKAKLSETRLGAKNGFFGKNHTEEMKKAMSADRKGRKWFNNGIRQLQSFECPEGFQPGRLKAK